MDFSFLSQMPSWSFGELVRGLREMAYYQFALELFLAVVLILLWRQRSYSLQNLSKTHLSEKEKADLINDWQPDPLVPDTPRDDPGLSAFMERTISSLPGKRVKVNGKECTNLCSYNFLGMLSDVEVSSRAKQCLRKYGVGSCGPRGFYGTIDVHLELEKRLADFYDWEETVLYSYGFSTIASAIPAYAKKGDVIFVDGGVNFAIQEGMIASRSTIIRFRHNDMTHLEELLKDNEAKEKLDPKKARASRKFLVVEGLYVNYGDICPLPELVEIKYRYNLRLFVEESCSLGVLGQRGRGVTEHHKLPVSHVDMIAASLEMAVGTTGGFCVGSTYIIDHQRLSGLGYCFSASLPPLCAAAGLVALDRMCEDENLVSKLTANSKLMHVLLQKIPYLTVNGDAVSPIKHLRLLKSRGIAHDLPLLERICEECQEEGVLLTVARYLKRENSIPPASIRLCVTNTFDSPELVSLSDTISRVTKRVFA